MDATPTLRITLRGNLDERVPPGGTDDQTMFADEEIDELLEISASIEEASWRGWLRKGTRVVSGSGLVKVTFGSEQFAWSDPAKLAEMAQKQADYWYGLIPPELQPVTTGAGSKLIGVYPPCLPGITVPYYGSGHIPRTDHSRLITEW